MSTFQYSRIRRLLHVFFVGFTMLTLLLLDQSQASTYSYWPLVRIKPSANTIVLSYGLGKLSCSKFEVQTSKSRANSQVDKLRVDIECSENPGSKDPTEPSKYIKVTYDNDKFNVNNNNDLAVLECKGTCKPSFDTLTLGNLPATVKIGKPNCPTTDPLCTITKQLGVGANDEQPLELKIKYAPDRSYVFFRLGTRRKFTASSPNSTLFGDDEESELPKASRYAGGATASGSDMTITAN